MPNHLKGARRNEILEAARAEIVEHGYEKATMDRVARRAQASKSTLYSWFGDKDGLAAAVIAAGADDVIGTISNATVSEHTLPRTLDEATEMLARVGAAMFALLTDPTTIAFDQAAVVKPQLIEVIHSSGRDRAGRIIIDYLDDLGRSGLLPVPDPNDAFSVLV